MKVIDRFRNLIPLADWTNPEEIERILYKKRKTMLLGIVFFTANEEMPEVLERRYSHRWKITEFRDDLFKTGYIYAFECKYGR